MNKLSKMAVGAAALLEVACAVAPKNETSIDRQLTPAETADVMIKEIDSMRDETGNDIKKNINYNYLADDELSAFLKDNPHFLIGTTKGKHETFRCPCHYYGIYENGKHLGNAHIAMGKEITLDDFFYLLKSGKVGNDNYLSGSENMNIILNNGYKDIFLNEEKIFNDLHENFDTIKNNEQYLKKFKESIFNYITSSNPAYFPLNLTNIKTSVLNGKNVFKMDVEDANGEISDLTIDFGE